MRTTSTAAATNTNAEKSYAGASFTIESGLSTDEILSKSDSSSASVWDEFESEKINYSQTQLSKRQKEEKDYEKVIKAPGAVLTVKSSKNLEVLCTSENIGVMIAVASQTTTARDVLNFFSPLAKSNDVDIGTETSVRRSFGNNTEMTNKERTELLREFLCGCAKRGSFSLIIYDAHSGRTCAARTAASPKLFFGFDKKKMEMPRQKRKAKEACVSQRMRRVWKMWIYPYYRRVDSFTVDNTLSRWSSHSFGRRLHRSKTRPNHACPEIR